MDLNPKLSALDAKERESILKRFRRKTIMEHLLGPFGSILFHVLVVVLAVRFMVFKSVEKKADIEVMMVEPDAVELEEFEKELEKMEELQDMTDMVAPPDVQMNVDAPAPSEAPGPQSDDSSMDLADLNVLSDSSPLVMKGLFAGRTEAGRASSLGQYGGRWAKATEQSVNKALEWLKNNQAPDGRWSSGPGNERKLDVGISGLCLLAILAHGETMNSEKYGVTVEKAIRFIVSCQAENGYFADAIAENEDIPYKANTYGHAIATYAISEAYGLTRIPDLKPVMEKAVHVILEAQQDGGGWDYGHKKTGKANSSVSGWHVQALKAAYLAGCDNPRVKESMNKYSDFIKKRQIGDTWEGKSVPDTIRGKFWYRTIGNLDDDHVKSFFGITAVSTLCLQLLGEGNSKEAKDGLNALDRADVDWTKPPSWAMSEWYYVTQAKFQNGGSAWEQWNNRFAREFVNNQNDDGSWTSPAKAGAAIPFGFEHFFGPAFSTSMACLTLQVYYRFLPTYKPIEVKEEVKPKDDVSIEII